jgi:hypothetical protein
MEIRVQNKIKKIEGDIYVGKDDAGIKFYVNDIIEIHNPNLDVPKYGIVYYYEEHQAYSLQICYIDENGNLCKTLTFYDFCHLRDKYFLFSNIYKIKILWNG